MCNPSVRSDQGLREVAAAIYRNASTMVDDLDIASIVRWLEPRQQLQVAEAREHAGEIVQTLRTLLAELPKVES